MPFIPTHQTFLSLALCGSIRDNIVPPPILADYLLYHLNLHNPGLYIEHYDLEAPTNDVFEFLAAVARKTGKLLRGGYVDEGAAAMDAVTRFRRGALGEWSVDRVTPDAFDLRIKEEVRARQREYQGSVLDSRGESRKGKRRSFKNHAYLGKSGTMSRAISEGREAARPKKKGRGRKPVKKAATVKRGKSGGVRKAINRNKGAKSKKRRK